MWESYSSFSKREWLSLILDENIFSERDMRVLKTMASLPGHGASAKILAAAMGFPHFVNANHAVGRLGKSLYKALELTSPLLNAQNWWQCIFGGEYKDKEFYWIMSESLFDAVNEIIAAESGLDMEGALLQEGECHQITQTRYERNREARLACIAHYGAVCQVCGLDFCTAYGPEFEGVIHVHHLTPVKNHQSAYHIDPINDLIPACPNCHTAIHKKDPPYTPEEITERLGRAAHQNEEGKPG